MDWKQTMDMMEELFISPRITKDERAGRGDCIEQVQKYLLAAWHEEEKKKLFEKLIKVCSQRLYPVEDVIGFLEEYRNDSVLQSKIGIAFLILGGAGESRCDYEAAIKYYSKSLEYDMDDSSQHYFRLNNLGFCYNFFRKFEFGESFCRRAIAIDSQRYNAWKNLGVSLEHQGKLIDAADCFYTAIFLSRREKRSLLHLLRLIERYPWIKYHSKLRDAIEWFPNEQWPQLITQSSVRRIWLRYL